MALGDLAPVPVQDVVVSKGLHGVVVVVTVVPQPGAGGRQEWGPAVVHGQTVEAKESTEVV